MCSFVSVNGPSVIAMAPSGSRTAKALKHAPSICRRKCCVQIASVMRILTTDLARRRIPKDDGSATVLPCGDSPRMSQPASPERLAHCAGTQDWAAITSEGIDPGSRPCGRGKSALRLDVRLARCARHASHSRRHPSWPKRRNVAMLRVPMASIPSNVATARATLRSRNRCSIGYGERFE
jgi:hypothetical protein